MSLRMEESIAALEKRKDYVVTTVGGPEANLHLDLSSRMMTATKKADRDQIGRQWNDLVEELVGDIMARLSSADLIRFGACCSKFWSLMPMYISWEIDTLPWLVKPCLQLSSGWEFELFDPLHKTPYSITRVDEITGQFEPSSSGMKLLASQHGWLLWWWERHEDQPPAPFTTTHSFLLVSPFTKQFKILPDLQQHVRPTWMAPPRYRGRVRSTRMAVQLRECVNRRSMVAGFSAEPSSPGGCIYIVFHGYDSDRRHVTISTCRNGDSEWKTVRLSALYLSTFDSAVYYDGSFYCCGTKSDFIGEYNVVANKWKCPAGRPQPSEEYDRNILVGSRRHDRYSYLLVCEGKLVLVHLFVPNWSKNMYLDVKKEEWFTSDGKGKEDRCFVYEYDSEQGDWVEKTSLGDHVLFLCQVGSLSVSVTSDIANRVYYYRPWGDGKKHYCSLEDYKSYPYGSSSTFWPGIEEGAEATWIQPPKLHPPRRLHQA